MSNKNSSSSAAAPKKRRWYHNFVDAYNVVKRTFPWITVTLILLPVLIIALGVLVGLLTSGLIFWIISSVMLAVLADLSLLAYLIRPAMYRQVDGRAGAVYAVLAQIRRGWVIEEEPVAVNKNQDMIWRIVGRPGVVLISEGPSSRVAPMLRTERQRITRSISNVPIVFIQSGHDEGQVPLPKLMAALRKQKKVLTKHEVPAVANRLSAIAARVTPIPKGVDPFKARPGSRRSLRGQ